METCALHHFTKHLPISKSQRLVGASWRDSRLIILCLVLNTYVTYQHLSCFGWQGCYHNIRTGWMSFIKVWHTALAEFLTLMHYSIRAYLDRHCWKLVHSKSQTDFGCGLLSSIFRMANSYQLSNKILLLHYDDGNDDDDYDGDENYHNYNRTVMKLIIITYYH